MSDRLKLRDLAILKHGYLNRWQVPDINAIRYAQALKRGEPKCSFLTGTWDESIFVNTVDGTANANTSAETSLFTGTNNQPLIPATFWNYLNAFGKSLRITARGILSTTSTPTLIFQLRLGTTLGASYLSGTSIGVTAAITCASGVSNQEWELSYLLTCRTPGQGSGNTTLSGAGSVISGGGFASPFWYPIQPTTPPTPTWTATIDNTVTQYVNLSTTWSVASSSNTITLKQCVVEGMN